MLVDTVILTPSGLNVLIALAGALIGMTVAALVVREHFASQRTLSIEHDLRESLERLEHQRNEPGVLDDVIRRQELSVKRIRNYAYRRAFFYRLLFGYLALICLAVAALWLLFSAQNISLQSGLLRWFAIGIGGAAVVNLLVYISATVRKLVTPRVLRPISIQLESDAELRKEIDIEMSVRDWLASQGFDVQSADPQSGLDLIAKCEGTKLLIEAKATSRLMIGDVNAVIGAAARLRSSTEMEGAIAVIAVPSEALKANASAAMQAAKDHEIAILAVDEKGVVAPAMGGDWASPKHAA